MCVYVCMLFTLCLLVYSFNVYSVSFRYIYNHFTPLYFVVFDFYLKLPLPRRKNIEGASLWIAACPLATGGDFSPLSRAVTL